MSVGWFEINHSKQEHTRQPTDFDISTYTSVFKKKQQSRNTHDHSFFIW